MPVWSGVRYVDLYPGVDLVLDAAAGGRLPWRLEVLLSSAGYGPAYWVYAWGQGGDVPL